MVKRFIEWRRKGGGGKGSKVASDVPVAVQGRVMLLNLATRISENLVLCQAPQDLSASGPLLLGKIYNQHQHLHTVAKPSSVDLDWNREDLTEI